MERRGCTNSTEALNDSRTAVDVLGWFAPALVIVLPKAEQIKVAVQEGYNSENLILLHQVSQISGYVLYESGKENEQTLTAGKKDKAKIGMDTKFKQGAATNTLVFVRYVYT